MGITPINYTSYYDNSYKDSYVSQEKLKMHCKNPLMSPKINLFDGGEGLLSFFTSGSTSESGFSCLTVSEFDDFFEFCKSQM